MTIQPTDPGARWQRLMAVLDAALDLDAGERNTFVAGRCRSDPSLRAEAEELLAGCSRAEIHLEAALLDLLRTLTVTARAGDGPPALPPLPLGDARFAPGEIFASRFRIVSLAGRGGMGEVYRADDLKLGQPVAIKLLTAAGAPDAVFQRFVSEVRLARGIAHPNVCRVYDLGHAGRWTYLAMEYVDGETLASLLRRIGRLPREKALDAARQLCAGIAAAHDAGVLHRDLKPSNVMMDGRGRIKIMDFGLAVAIDDAAATAAGTPAYMAPEQLAADPATKRTDLYALGLILCEVFTGRIVFSGTGIHERRSGNAAEIVRELGADLDQSIREIICRCLEPDPDDRPPSADAVAAMLPGGDLLTAAVSEGRVLSPEAVATARVPGSLSATTAALLLAGIVVGMLAVVARMNTVLPGDVPKPPEVLVERARNILGSIGYGNIPGDSEFWFESAGRIRFLYRQTPALLVPQNIFRVVTELDPPQDTAGMATVALDPDGRLIRLSAISAGGARGSGSADWDVLFAHAGLTRADFVPADPIDNLLTNYDTHVAWVNAGVGANGPLRVSGASLGGQPVSFIVTDDAIPRKQATTSLISERPAALDAILSASIVLAFIAGGVRARRNVRLGLGDRRGARRLAVFVVCGSVLSFLLRAHYVPDAMSVWTLFFPATAWALQWGALAWLMYLSLEPYVRTHWPALMISWMRVISGRLTDPLVGRDILMGLAAGIVYAAAAAARLRLMDAAAFEPTYSPVLDSLRSGRHLAFVLVFYTLDALMFSVGGLFFLLLLRARFRKQWIAIALFIAFDAVLIGFGMKPGLWTWVLVVTIPAIGVAVLLRLGFLPFALMMLAARLLTRVAVTLDFRAWYADTSFAVLSLIAALALYGYLIATSSRHRLLAS